MTYRHRLFAGALALVLVLSFSATLLPDRAAAQGGGSTRTLDQLNAVEIPIRDAPDLAERLSGLVGAASIPVEPAPAYAVGDREVFLISHSDNNEIFEVEAELAAASPGIYLWVESTVGYDADAMARTADFLDEQLFPEVRELFGSEANPGIDADPHIYILNVTGVGDTIGGYFNDNSTYSRRIFSASNEHEMFVVAIDNIPLHSVSYLYVLAHEFVHMIQHNQDENEETWVTEGMAELGAFMTVTPGFTPILSYLADPTIQLNAWDIDQPRSYYGASSLFFSYLVERFGRDFVLTHSQEPADGINGIDAALAALGATDAATGDPLTFDDVFADWLVTNLLNDGRVGDGRYDYDLLDLGESTAALTAQVTQIPASLQAQQVNQFGAQYIGVTSETPQTMTVSFSGTDTVQVVPTSPHSGSRMYWANRSDQSNPRLTRAFDLRGVDGATLHFWTWYEMEPFWDYGYLSVSTDDGATWTPLQTAATTADNPNNRAFAAGLTGFSVGGTDWRPAPFIGITFNPSTGVITGVVPGSGAADGGMIPGDRLVALDGETLFAPRLADELLAFAAGDMVTFTVVREDEALDLPVTLGEHPERAVRPRAAWMEQTVNLNRYAGQEVLLRFEYVTDQAFTRNGWVLDDISIPEIGYSDDAESGEGGWFAEGWTRIENTLPQNYAVQVVEGAGLDRTVRLLLSPGEGHSGTWTISVTPDAPAVLIVSAMTRYTTQPATFDLLIDPAE